MCGDAAAIGTNMSCISCAIACAVSARDKLHICRHARILDALTNVLGCPVMPAGMKRARSFGGRSPSADDLANLPSSAMDRQSGRATPHPQHQHQRFEAGPAIASPALASGPVAAVQELYGLAVLNMAINGAGRQRQVGPFGSCAGLSGVPCALPSSHGAPHEEAADCGLIMPLHCAVAAALLQLCLTADDVVEGHMRW